MVSHGLICRGTIGFKLIHLIEKRNTGRFHFVLMSLGNAFHLSPAEGLLSIQNRSEGNGKPLSYISQEVIRIHR